MKSHPLRYSVLITTLNRKKNLRILLDSVSNLSILPFEIIIASSGESVLDLMYEYRSILNIKVVHCDKRGQVFQKKQALNALNYDAVEWILFCDDDIFIAHDALDHFSNWLQSYPYNETVGGVGFNCISDKKLNSNRILHLFKYLFFVMDKPPGVVKRNGHITDYMQSKEIVFTDWLNSGSIWRVGACQKYNVAFEHAPHALGEDLIFSYTVSKESKLVYFPTSKIYFQTDFTKSVIQTSQVFRTRSYHMLYFVLLNKELSSLAYLWSLLGRTVHILIVNRKYIAQCKKIVSIFFDILFVVCRRKNAEFVLEFRINK
jgi:glycosyltransferase involved in cell wall biosynthesis